MFTRSSGSSDPDSRWYPWQRGLLAVLLVAAVGCSGGDNLYSWDVGALAERSLPAERRTETHPDSLQRLSIVEEENQIRFELEESYQQMHVAWSSSFQFATARRDPPRPLTYATLWSKELSLAALQAEQGLSSFSKEQALSMIEKQQKEYRKTLQIDVYWFSGPDATAITGPGARVRLRDDQGHTYHPVRDDNGPLRHASIFAGQSVLYRRNIFYFQRQVDGRDILKNVDKLRLTVTPTGAPTVGFAWSWEDR